MSGGGIPHRIALGPEAVSQAMAAVRAFCAVNRLGDCGALAVIVEELVCNLVDHGGRAGDVLELDFALGADGLRVSLADGGAPFDPRAATDEGRLPPERGGGAGLALVRAWATIESYARIGGRNHLHLLIPPDRLG